MIKEGKNREFFTIPEKYPYFLVAHHWEEYDVAN